MKRIAIAPAVAALPLLLTGCQFDQETLNRAISAGQQVYTASQPGGQSREALIASGLKEALSIGSERAATTLSAVGGYAKNPALRLTLPESVQPLAKTLRQIGMGSHVDKVEADMNRAAELAAAKAVPVFRSAVTQMTLADAVGILKGGDNAATTYFRGRTESALRTQFAPIIQGTLQQTGYYDSYRQMLAVYNKLPVADKPSLDLEQHILDRSLDGLFTKLADEEALIRRDPAKRTTELLKQVFGGTLP
ncbi:MAG: DUF4197 domain-containing protein [Pseudomonadota bacterium]